MTNNYTHFKSWKTRYLMGQIVTLTFWECTQREEKLNFIKLLESGVGTSKFDSSEEILPISSLYCLKLPVPHHLYAQLLKQLAKASQENCQGVLEATQVKITDNIEKGFKNALTDGAASDGSVTLDYEDLNTTRKIYHGNALRKDIMETYYKMLSLKRITNGYRGKHITPPTTDTVAR